MNEKQVKEMYDFFEDYINKYQFNSDDSEKMKLIKYDHTMRVTNVCIEIARSVFDKQDDIYLCEIIGLYHDIGRWKQYSIYKNFNDHETENHAKLSVDVLVESRILDKLQKDERQIVLDSIYEHNKMYIESITDSRTLTFAKIIRDADRIDNYLVDCEINDINNENKKVYALFPESDGISDEVYDCIRQKKLVKNSYRKNNNDFKFSKLAWIFDMSFEKSFQIVKDNKYVDKIYHSIKNPDKKMKELYTIINDFIEAC